MLPEAYYKQQLTEKTTEHDAAFKKVASLSWLRLALAVALIGVFYLLVSYNQTWQWIAAGVGLISFFYLLRVHAVHKERVIRLRIHLDLINAELKAVNDDHSSFLNGNGYINAAHPYSYDLDLFGRGSIYQMLCRAATKDGEKELAALLEYPYATEEQVLERQQCIRELAGKSDFMETFRISGMRYEEDANDRKKVLSWLHGADKFLHKKYLFAAAAIIPILTVLFGVLSVQQGGFHQGLLYILVFNWIILLTHSKDIKETHLFVGRSVKLIDKYEHLLRTVAGEQFNYKALKQISTDASGSVSSIVALRKLAHLFDSRQNGMVGPLMNSFFLFDIYCVLRLELWRKKNRDILDDAFRHITQLDIYVSLATYAFNNPEHTYPHVSNEIRYIEAIDIKHPLLNRKAAIGNTMSLGHDEKLYLLTGANMTGKSTFIRTIGVSLILAYIGIPVRAASYKVPLLHMYTAIRISDSVQDDISYFKAELNRMQQLMQAVQQSPVPYLVLLDEPLRGTNSTDKQMGTQSVMEKLLTYNAVGIVATHDTGLCKLEQLYPGKISNYHFESEVTESGLKFDFKLKQGESTSNNATILMKLMGIV